MAVYRQIQTSFWQDEFVLNLTPEEKYFYVYLLTNSKTKQCGIYQLPMPIIIVETGYNQETVEKLMHRFIDNGKIIYSLKTREIDIVNWPKYNSMESPKTKACVLKELKEVKDKSLIDNIYPMQGVSQKEQEKEKEKEKEKTTTEEPASDSSGSSSYHEDFCHSREGGNLINQSIMLFTRIWNITSSTPEEQRLVTGYLTSYGFLEVEFAFREALKHNNRKLVYVEGICKKRKEKIAIEKSKEEASFFKYEPLTDSFIPDLNIQFRNLGDTTLAANKSMPLFGYKNFFMQLEAMVTYSISSSTAAYIHFNYVSRFSGNNYSNNFFQIQLGASENISSLFTKSTK